MPDLGTQLRNYFDETVERMTEEDIRIRASTARGVPVRVPRFRIKPVAAAATGFGIAMTLLGGVMVAAELLEGEPGDVGGNGTPGGSAVTDPQSSMLLLLLMAGFGLLAFGMWSMRRSAGDVRERGDESMQTIERPEAVEAPGDIELKGRNRLLTWLVAILAVAVIGLGAWLVVELTSSSDARTLPAEAEVALDEYGLAWETRDRAAFLATTTDDYTFMSGFDVDTRAEQANTVGYTLSHFEAEVFDTVVAGSRQDRLYVTESSRVRFFEAGPWFEGMSTFTLVNINGDWKVAQHTWIGDMP